jgi:hypothetical protein
MEVDLSDAVVAENLDQPVQQTTAPSTILQISLDAHLLQEVMWVPPVLLSMTYTSQLILQSPIVPDR